MTLQARYTVRRKIADGGTAEIFLAIQRGAHGFEKSVVLKRIFPALYSDPQFRNMLIDEAHVAMSLNHSNIVQVLDLGEADGQYVLALELVDGWNLDSVLRRSRALNATISPALALYITAEVCRALAYAHAKVGANDKPIGIVHRDISPHNVLLSEQGEVKLTDFGIAKTHSRRESSIGNIIKGKIAYMAPEQASGGALDSRSDLFSVGTMLYVMVCHRYPFDAPTDLEVLLLVQNGEFEPPENVVPALNPEIYRVIKRALAKDPDARYQRAEEMLIDVEQVMRTGFRAVGQTELKRWLQDLSTQDNVLPLTRQPLVERTEDAPAEGETLELKGVGTTTPSPAVPSPPLAGNLSQGAPSGPLRLTDSGRIRPPPPAAAMAVGKRPPTDPGVPVVRLGGGPESGPSTTPKGGSGSATATASNATAGDKGRPKDGAAARRGSRRKASRVAKAGAHRAQTTPLPPVGTQVPQPPVTRAQTSVPSGGTVAAPAEGLDTARITRPRSKRSWLLGSGAATAALLVVVLVRACGADGPAPGTKAADNPLLKPGTNPVSGSIVVPPAAPPASGSGTAVTTDPGIVPGTAPGIAPPPVKLAQSPTAVAPPAGSSGLAGDGSRSPAGTAVAPDDSVDAGPNVPTKMIVSLMSTPPGAQVATTKRILGVTPVNVRLKVGQRYALTFSLPGYELGTKHVRIEETGDQEVNAVLRKEGTPSKGPAGAAASQSPPGTKGDKGRIQRLFAR
ncbi:MAG: protein kinase [Polyangia bacterium]